ncbi:MAG: UPF0175 family protein [Candidatus Acidiferrum sp.]
MSKDSGSMNGDAEKSKSANRIDEACRLYAEGKLSRGPAARLAGLDRAAFDVELYRRKIPSYTPEMLEQDLALIREEPPK